jgi:predicted ThiF/HesA family dinucleotide-utilizing enzyme
MREPCPYLVLGYHEFAGLRLEQVDRKESTRSGGSRRRQQYIVKRTEDKKKCVIIIAVAATTSSGVEASAADKAKESSIGAISVGGRHGHGSESEHRVQDMVD